ncbi:O-antigen ligase [Cellulomonas sp. P24]|uniref:O-antigen ligase family protein n=1 Tax=Cellulomonas sp. P24 TaxID=2885206 RepID=UPI00216AFC26|nr:O-antigen ligase family protein [Cellulomonas sp. P24]MCR6493759.1 O-antigen ligase family protein [Cellulomonas sp. P24]
MIRRRVAWVAAMALIAALLTLVGALVPRSSVVAVVVAAFVLVIGLTIYEPAAVPILTMPLLVVVERVGGDSVNLSLSDFALFGGFCFAVVFAPRPYSRPMRSLLWLAGFYQVTTLFTVVANPYIQNTVEWFHAWLSVAGALVVGWAVGRSGRARIGMTMFMVACLAIAALTGIASLTQLAAGNTGPVYLYWPFGMHKNFIGIVLAFAALVAYVRPSWVGWSPRFALTSFWFCSLGVVASQARQALVGLAVAVMVVTLRTDPDRKRSRLILLAAIPAAYSVALAIQDQLASTNAFNSANQRLTWYQQAFEVWQSSPWFGVGLRWWVAGRTQFGFQPPNAELEVLSSVGLVGLVGFLALFLGALTILWRRNPRFGTLAFTMLLMRFIQGQFDLFWSSVVVSVPFVIVGVCLGAEAYARENRPHGRLRAVVFPTLARLDGQRR